MANVNEHLGIEKIKETVDVLVRFLEAVVKLAKDRDFLQLIVIGQLLAQYKDTLEDAAQAWKEIKDLSDEEAFDLNAYLKERIDLDNDELEERIEGVLDLVPKAFVKVAEAEKVIADVRKALEADQTTREKIGSVLALATSAWVFLTGVFDYAEEVADKLGDLF